MKRRLSLTAIVVLMNNVLTPFSYAFTDEMDVLGVDENVVVEEVVETPVEETLEEEDVDEEASIEEEAQAQEESPVEEGEGDEEAQVGSGLDSSVNVSEGQTGDTQNDVNNNPGSESMTGQDSNSEQNESGVESGLNSEAQTGNTQTGSGLDSSVNTLEGQTGDVESLTGDIKDSSLNSEGGNIQTGSALSGDTQSLSGDKSGIDIIEETIENNPIIGDVLTGDVETLTGEILTGEIFTGDVMTGSAIDTLNTALEEIAAQREAEIAKIRETLNEEVISGQEMYKDVIVNVEAPEGSFPSVAELRITPITGNIQQQQIKDQLVENTDVTEESELVAFDISFIYTLTSGEEIELQPYTGQTVKVSFNYVYNDNLAEANSDDNKQLKVYHLEEVKDERGKKTEEVEVKEVEINQKATSDGELVVDAERFSPYVVAAVDAPVLRAADVEETPASCFDYDRVALDNGSYGIHITNYDINTNNGCTTDVVIPSYITYNGTDLPVVWLSYYSYDSTQTSYGHDGVFENKGINSVVIPDTVKRIGKYTFYGNNLTSVEIPDSVEVLETASFNNNNFSCEDGFIYARNNGVEDRTTIVSYAGGSSCTSVVIPEGVTTIKDRAFYKVPVSQVTLPSSITTIEALGFYYTSLTSIFVPATVSSLTIGTDALKKSSGSVTCYKENNNTTVNGATCNTTTIYKVLFDTDGGSEVPYQLFNSRSSSVAVPTVIPVKRLYTFNGWYYYNTSNIKTNFTTATTFTNMFGNSATQGTVYAEWTKNPTAVVTYNGNGGNVSTGSVEVEIGYPIDVWPKVSRFGYKLTKWTTDQEGNNEFIDSTIITGNIVLYAQWEEVQGWTVIFNSNGGSSVETQYIEDGERATKPVDPTKTNQIFMYWTTDSAGNNEYNFDTPVTDNLELFAQWGDKCTVTFQNGYCYRGRNSSTQCNFSLTATRVDVACGTPVRRPEDPERWDWYNYDGYRFYISKWATRNNPGYNTTTYDYDFSTPVTGDLDLYAIGYNNYRTVTFNANGGTLNGPSTAQVGYYNNSYGFVREPDDPTREGYTFKRWSTSNNTNGSEFNFNTTRITGDTPLYALWTPITYTIKYNANGGVGNMSDTDMVYATARNLSSNTFTKTNATFSGWNTQANGGGTWYTNNQSVNNMTTTSGTIINLYAQWKCNNGYHDENGACVSSTKTVSCNTGSTPENATPTVVDVEITWNNGTWSSPTACAWNCNTGYMQSGNSCVPASCSFQGQTIENGGSLTVYSNTSPTCPTACITGTVTCTNGQLGGDTSYTNLSCATVSKTCDSSYTLSSEGSHGTYSSCTPSIANGTTCTAGTTVYKLDSCDTGYHTEDNATCISNSRSVACDSDLVPVNSTAIPGNVTITWNGTWNSGSWSATGSCDWTCNEHYHTGANNTSCELDTYQVTWKNRDNSTLETDTVGYGLNPSYDGATPTKPSDSNYRYVFNGWTPAISPVEDDVVYTATYKSYDLYGSLTVTFDTDGGSSIDPQVLNYGDKATKPSNPTKNGYAFDYWSTDTAGNNAYDFNSEVTSDLELHAQWTENVCTVTFQNGYCYRNKGNDAGIVCGYTLGDPINVKCGSTISRSDVYEPAEPYHTSQGNRTYYFARWSTTQNPGLTNNSTTFDFSTPITKDIILYAIGGDPSYDVTFNGNGGNPSSYVVTVGVYGLVRRPADPVKEGYKLLCWTENQTDTSCANPYDFDAEENRILANKTLYAQWTPITYTVVYNANGGEGNMSGSTMSYGVSDNLRKNTFTRLNATFSGWNTKTDGSGIGYRDEQSVINLSTTQGSIVRLYALWNCNDGYMWSGDVCVTANCTFQGQTIENGGRLTVYSSAAPTCPTTCTQGTVTCTNGKLGGDTDYTNLSCTTVSKTCDSSFSLTTTGAHGTYSSCTPYTSNGKGCTKGSTVYKLDSCDAHYHTGSNGHCTIDTFQITWKDGDEQTLTTGTVNYNVVPTYSGATPTKTATAQYTYTWNGTWSPTPVAATADATYTAQFNSSVNNYTVSIKSNNTNSGSVDKSSVTVPYGTGISINGNKVTIGTTTVTATPETDTAQWDFEFVDWTNTCGNSVSTGCTITAIFKSTLRSYTVTWKNYDGTTLETDENVEYGTTPTYNGATPTKARTDEFTYEFAGWSPAISTVTGNITYTATYTSTTNKYLITFKNRDGTVLKTGNVAYGAMPTAPANPSRAADNTYTYTFKSWTPSIHAVSGAQVYTATYDPHYIDYTITWRDYNGTQLSGATYHYNDDLVVLADPSRVADNTYTYTFKSWTPSLQNKVTGNKTYTATYTPKYIDYTITFVNWNNSEISSGTYHYGDTVTVPADPTRPADEQYTYRFTGWSPAVSSVTKSQVYTATYSSSVNQYTATIEVNPAGYGSVTSGAVKKDWGTDISVEGNTLTIGTTTITAAPTSRSDEFTYTFSGWTNNCGAKLTGDCTITANFTRTTNEYLITFKNWDGTTLKSSNVEYGTTPTAPANPSRPATAQYTYSFSGWNPSIRKVNGVQVYTAVYTSTVNNYKVTIKSNNTASGNVNPTEVTVPYGTQISTSSNILTIGNNTITATPTENDAQYTYSFVNWTNNCGSSVTTGCVITANFNSTVNQYEITFNSNSGSAVASQTKYYGEKVTKPADPTREGYNFSGWYSDSQLTNKYNFTETVTGPLTLHAKWTAKGYTISYDLDGGTVSSANPTSYTIESAAITLNNPTKTGYTFKGWTGTGLDRLTMNVTIPTGSIGNRSYTANWEAKNVKITINHHLQNLNANTNTLLDTYSDYRTLTGSEKADSIITLANYKLTNITGFVYDYAKVNGTQATTTTVLPDGSRVIDLYYTRSQYSFTLNSENGATTAGSSTSKNYYYGAKITLSGDVSSDCYMWNQWNVQGAQITNNKKTTFSMPANAVTAQPSVTEKTYNIAFDGTTKTSGSMSTLNGVKCTVTRILPENGFEKTGYTFSGWATTSGGAKVYENKGEVTTLSTTNGATVTLYAVWTPNPDTPYVVNHWYLDVNGDIDNNNKQTQNLTGISDASITPDFISKDGFNNPTQKITTTIAANGSTVVNYQYTRKEYTLHFVTTGTIVDDRDVVYGGALNVDETSAISGYTFLGWSPNPEGQTMPLSGLTLTATWRANSDTPYRVEHYMERLGGGYPDSPNYIENLTGTTDTQTKAKAMNVSGFTLSGNIASYQKNINGDVDNNKTVVKVYYTRDTHTITFVKDNGETNYVVTAKYSGDVVKPADPIKTGYTFIGWDKTVPNKMPAEDMTITAQWQINQYTIHFNTNGGTEVADITQDYDTAVTAPANPTKEGYTFAGWDKTIPAKMPAEDMTINANWTINSYEIRFRDSENRYEDVVYTGNYNSSTSSIKKPTWTKTGYTIHWDKEIPVNMPAEDTLITATWTINKYRIKFTTSGSVVSDIYEDYGTVINTEPQTEQYGYTFSGWYYSGQKVNFPYTIDDQNKTFVAHWDINQYTITFNSDGGTPVVAIKQDYNTQVARPADPEKEGYTFNGWYDENNTLVQWPHILTKDETFKANWTINAYTITFDANEGTPSYSYRQDYNTSISKPADPTRTGYTFTGWYDGDQKITFPYKVPATDKTLQAHWDINQYTITFVQNNGQPNIVITQDYNSDITAPANPTKNGYTFAGWDKEIPGKMPAYNQSITANWTLNTYNISYDVKGGINNSNNPNTYTVESEKITLGDPTKTGYIFSGWIGDNGSTPEKGVVIPHGTTGNKSYIAVWDLEKYMLTYDLDGGINNPENPDEYTIETPTFTIKEPTKVGYTFLGWTGSNGTELMKTIQLAKGNYGNKKYYANWKANTYRIKYISNGGELGVNSPTSVVYDKSFTVDNPTKTGYTFSGWEITGMDSVEHTYGNDTTNSNSIASTKATSFMNLHSASGSEVTFTAQWTKNTYNVSYNLNGGKYGDNHPTIAVYDETFNVSNPTRTGYVFSGWRITGMNNGVTHHYGNSTTTATTIENTKETSFKNLHSVTSATVTFTAEWTPIEYTITYNLDGGALNQGETNPTKYTIETPTFVLKTPTKTGYDFSGWVDGSGNFSRNVTIAQGSIGDRSYTAIYEVHKWSLRFLQDGEPLYSGLVSYGDPVVIPNTGSISKEGYHFTGWTPSPVPATMPDNNLTFNVVWEVNTHTVTYVSEGQTFEKFTGVSYGTEILQPRTTPTKIGYHFVRWTGDVALSDTMPDRDVTFTAVFEKNDYVVQLSASPITGGSVAGAGTYKYNDSITVNATNNYGFTFSGWKVGNEFVSRNASYTFTADAQSGIALVAVFDINSYNVSVQVSDPKMGSVIGSGRYVYMTQAQLIAADKQGYHFVEWRTLGGESVFNLKTYIHTVSEDTGFVAVFAPDTNTPYVVNHFKQNLDGTYPSEPTEFESLSGTTDDEISPAVKRYEGFTSPEIQTTTISSTGATVVNYKYERNSYTITFNTNGGNTIAPITGKYESNVTAPADPTRTGYTFTGWDKDIPNLMPAYSQTINAGWRINQYTIHFDTDGGSAIADITQDYDTAITAPADPTKVGYTFAGWDKEIPERMPATGMTITALWTINQYTITFDTDGGSAIAPITQNYNTAITAPADPTKTGYRFAGWTPSIPSTMPAYSQTITGSWTPRDDTRYVVYHKQEQLDGTYLTVEVYTGQGTTNTNVTPSVRTYEGFTSPSAQTVNIEPDGSRVVVYQYTRNSYQLTFDTVGGTSLSGKTLKYKEPIGTIGVTTKTGYHLSEDVSEAWINYPNDGKMPAKGITLIANWIPNPDTPYTVKHYLQNIDGTYPTTPADIDNLTGETASTITPKVKEYHGFEAPEVSEVEIAADGSTLVELRYRRLTYTVNYLTDGGDSIDSTGVIFGDIIPTPTPHKTGFDFVKWSGLPDNHLMPDYELDLTAIWTESKNTPYRVEYWLEDIQTGHYTLYTGLNFTGTTNAEVKPAVPGHTGFNSPDIQTAYIAPEGNTLIVYQYERKSFTLSYNTKGGLPQLESKQVRYEDLVTTGVVERPGYTFESWDDYPLDGKMPAGNLELVAKWEANTNTPYIVEHYLQHLNDTGYDLRLSRTGHGTTDTNTAAAPLHYPGWTPIFNSGTDQKNINGDGSTVVKIYYDRDTYKIIYNMAGGDPIATGFAKYDAELQPILDALNPHRLGYDFHQWNGLPKEGGKMPANDLYLTAEWTARSDTPYTVNHYREDITIGEYTLHETEYSSGVTDSVITVPIKMYTGFKNPAVKTGKIVAVPEGETGLVINYYYNRDSFTLTYDVDGGAPVTVPNPVPVRYEVTINTGVTTTKTGYIFSGWSNVPENGKMPAKPLTIKAIWEPDDVNYTVQHKLQSIDDETVYELSGALTEVLTGKSDSQTKAVAKDLSGFTAQTITQKKISPNGTTVVEVKYTRKSYTISFNSRGGTAVESITDKYDSDVTKPVDPTKTGYTFSGWNPSVPAKMPAHDMELMAEWINNKYTVSFNANGGEGTTSSLTATYDERFTLTANGFTRNGYTFSGWAMSESGAKVYGDKEEVKTNLASESGANVVLYAVWDLDTYNINYNLNGGSVAGTNPIKYDVNSGTFTLINPTRDGYNFAGWTGTELSSATQTVTIPQGSTGNREYTATWQAIVYTITYDANSGTLASNPGEYTIESATITIVNPTRTGYKFTGWTGTELTQLTNPVTIVNGSIGNRHYVANWEARDDIQYKVEHYQEQLDGSYKLVDSELLSGTTDQLTQAEAKPYDGFIAQSFGQVVVTADKMAVVKIEYNRKYYDVSVEGERGIQSVIGTGSYKYQQPVRVTVNVKSGYTIDGLTGHNDYDIVVSLNEDENIIRPVIGVITYNISYNLDGGSLSGTNPATYDVENGFTLENPTRIGYDFAGWTGTDLSEKIMNVVVNTGSIGNRNYTANWTARNDTEYKVRHVYEGIESIAEETVTKTHTGTSDTTVTGQLAPKTGFTSPAEKTIYITADGKAEITYNYERIKYTVTYDSNGGLVVNSWTGKFGATIPRPNLSRDGYRFDGWSGATTVPAENTGLVAQWTALEVNYLVKHMRQNANDGNYTEHESETLTGITDKQTNVIAKTYSGFKAGVFSNTGINGNGSTVVEVKYDREIYTVTFNSSGGTAVASITGKYEQNITAPANPRLSGYTFMGWNPAFPSIMPLGGTGLTAVWEANTGTVYTVKHFFEDLSGNYVENPTFKDELRGTTNTYTQAVARTVAGFSGKDIAQQIINGDGTTEVRVEYDRNVYTVTYDANGGSAVDSWTGKFEAEIPNKATTRSGYDFVEWTGATNVPADNVTVIAVWKARSDTPYTIRHMQENADDTGYTLFESGTGYGTTEELTDAQAKIYSGFKAGVFNNVIISGNGSTVVEIKYDRIEYDITFDTSTGTHVNTITAKYGATVNRPANPELSGYDFVDWDPEFPSTMPLGGTGLTAVWLAHDYTPYTVKHFFEDLNGNDVEDTNYEEHKTGTTDTLTNAQYAEVTGFTGKILNQVNIDGNGKAVATVFYSRNTYTVTYDSKGGTPVADKEFKYEATIDRPNITRNGYTFSGWLGAITMPAENTGLVAIWEPKNNTHYTVEHYQQNITDDEYTLKETEDKIGRTEDDTAASGMDYKGFTMKSFEQQPISGDGNTVIRIYYDRNEYTISFETSTGTNVDPITARYDSGITAPSDPQLSGYTFNGWSPEFPSNMPYENMTLVAQWTANTGTKYTVEHYLQQLDGSYPTTPNYTDNLSGTTDTQTNAKAMSLSGFTAQNFEQVNIDGRGDSVVKIRYTRDSYNVSYAYANRPAGASELPATSGYKYEQTVIVATGATAPGYDFVWNRTGTFNMPANDVVITGTFTARSDTKYTVEFYEQQADGTYSNEATRKDESRVWTTDETVSVTEADKQPNEGYAFDASNTNNVLEGVVNGYGTLVLKVYFKKQFTVKFQQGDKGTFEEEVYSGLDYNVETPLFRGDLDVEHLSGYTFSGWNPSVAHNVTENVTYVAQWKANTDTPYKVIYKYKGTNDGIDEVEVTKIYKGTTDSYVPAPLVGSGGFKDPNQQYVTILGDGSAEVVYVYDREEYTLSYDANGGTPVESKPITYGALNDTGVVTSRTGYTFVEWTGDVRMPLNGTTLTAVWTPNTGTKYYVEHYQENIAGDGYDLIETDVLSGTTDTTVTPSTKTYEGFTSPSVVEINIDPDGNATVKYYYSRNSYNLTIKDRSSVLVNKDVKYGDIIELPDDPTWIGHTFIRWSNYPSDGKMPASALEITAVWDVNSYILTFDTDGGSEIEPIIQDYGTPIIPPANPTKDRHHFIRWEPEIPETMPDHDMTIKAIWEMNGRSGGGGRGNGGSSDEHGSADDQPQGGTGSLQPDVDPEVLAAYEWAYKYGITTIEGFENANPDGLIPRGHMAKMVTNFAVNVLGREIPSEIPAECSWENTDWESEEIKDYATKACALGVMGIYMEDFLPNKILDRAELGTIISRLLWGDTYNVIDTNNRPYYVEHLNGLKREGIMTQIQNPEARKELRKWAWVMLMRVQQ